MKTCAVNFLRRGLVLFALLFGVSLSMAEIDLTKPIPELRLKDGRVLKDASLKAFNSKTVFVKCAAGLIQVRNEVFPDELQPQLKIAREETAAINSYKAPVRKERDPVAEAKRTAVERQQRETEKREARERAEDEEQQRRAAEARINLVKGAVREKADNYFRYEDRLGSGYVAVRSLSIEMEEPEEFSGWTGRYTVKGKGHLEYYDSYRGSYSFSRANRSFIATVEIDQKGKAKVIGFDRGVID